MSVGPAIAYQWLAKPKLVVFYQSTQTGSDEEWKAYETFLTELGTVQLRVFAYSDGGRPTSRQQDSIMSLPQFASWPIAMVSPSLKVRFMATSIAMRTSYFQLFTPEELRRAYAQIQCTDDEIALIEKCLLRLREQLYEGTDTSQLPNLRIAAR